LSAGRYYGDEPDDPEEGIDLVILESPSGASFAVEPAAVEAVERRAGR
jgi:hypothetical protein